MLTHRDSVRYVVFRFKHNELNVLYTSFLKGLNGYPLARTYTHSLCHILLDLFSRVLTFSLRQVVGLAWPSYL